MARSAFLSIQMVITFSVIAIQWQPASGGDCASIKTFADGLSPSHEIHVSPTGNDGGGDGSFANPYATIAFAAGQANPGTAVMIHEGTYAGGGFAFQVEGTASQPIWIGGAPGESRPIIDGGGTSLQFVEAKYVVIHDLEVQNSSQNGLNFDDGGQTDDPLAAHHLIFRNLNIHDIGGTGNQDGLKLSGIRDFRVIDCEFARCGGGISGSGIDMVGCHRGLITTCLFNDFTGNAIQIKGGSSDIEVQRCRITEAGERGINIGGSTGFQFFRPPLSTASPNTEASNIRIYANIFEGTRCSFAFVGCVDCTVANNTIVTPHNWIFRILQETTSADGYEFLPCSNNRLSNNLVYFDRSDLSTYVNIGPDTQPETFTFSNNLWYAYDNPPASQPSLPAVESGGIYEQNPMLNDPDSGDYQITADSPAASQGIAPLFTPADYAGLCYQDPPSIGAFEFESDVRFGDSDANGDVDLVDFAQFQLCFTGPNPSRPPSSSCTQPFDAEPDGDIDLADFGTFQLVFGP
jgi:hypothetical protein